MPVLLLAQQVPTFRTEVSQVHVDAEVLSADGHVITGLSGTDFRVFDEGKSQAIVALRGNEEPLDLVLLIDVSGSMRLAPQKLRAASQEAFGELRNGDRIEVVTFNNRSRVVLPFTENLGAVDGALDEITTGRFGGGTYIHQAIDDTAQNLMNEQKTGRRRAILIVTDNVGRRTISEQRVVRDLWEADAVLMGLVFHQPGFETRRAIAAVIAPYALINAGRGMGGIAAKTGGATIDAEKTGSAFTQAMHRIRSRYSIYYAAPEAIPGSYRSIRVELAPEAQGRYPGARVYARRGYRLER